MNIETVLIHGNPPKRNSLGAVTTPVYLTSAFSDAARNGYSYTRCHNPTREALEDVIAAAEGGKYCFAFSSGLAAEDALFSAFDRIVTGNRVYGGTRRLLETCYSTRGAEVIFTDVSDMDCLSAALENSPPSLVFAETPANPLMDVTDIRAAADAVHAHGGFFAVDNTFLTPVLQRPLALGADAAVHSATKYLCGHHDSTAGCVVTNDGAVADKLQLALSTKGNGLSPFDSFLVKRGLQTLSLRMRAHCENAAKVFEFLRTADGIARVYYPGDPDSPGYATMLSQSKGFGGMLAFEPKNTDLQGFLSRLGLILFAESLGGNVTLITHPYTQTHASLTAKQKAESGITPALLRLSVGTENADDIIADLHRALACDA